LRRIATLTNDLELIYEDDMVTTQSMAGIDIRDFVLLMDDFFLSCL